jgi:hypothetical protein
VVFRVLLAPQTDVSSKSIKLRAVGCGILAADHDAEADLSRISFLRVPHVFSMRRLTPRALLA